WGRVCLPSCLRAWLQPCRKRPGRRPSRSAEGSPFGGFVFRHLAASFYYCPAPSPPLGLQLPKFLRPPNLHRQPRHNSPSSTQPSGVLRTRDRASPNNFCIPSRRVLCDCLACFCALPPSPSSPPPRPPPTPTTSPGPTGPPVARAIPAP